MRKLYAIVVVGLSVGVLFWAFGPFWINAKGNEAKVGVSDLPAAVRAALEKEAPNGEIEEIEKEEKDGKVVYEVDVKIEGKELELKIAADGTVLKKEAEEEEEKEGEDRDEEDEEDEDEGVTVTLGDLPDAVKATLNGFIEKEAPGAKIEEIEKEVEDGEVIYDIELEAGDKDIELEIAEDGTLLEKEVAVDDDDEGVSGKDDDDDDDGDDGGDDDDDDDDEDGE